MAAKIATSIGLAFDIIGVFHTVALRFARSAHSRRLRLCLPDSRKRPGGKGKSRPIQHVEPCGAVLDRRWVFSSDRRCVASDGLMRWRWRYTNEFGKRVESRWHMSEETAKAYKDAEKIEGTEEIRTPLGSTGDFMKSQPKSEPERLLHPVGTLPIRSLAASAA